LETLVKKNFWKNRKVLITGHTGFKGSWLLMLLEELYADIFGYALEPETEPSLFLQANLSDSCCHKIANIQDALVLQEYVDSVQPEVVFHLAAQPLVRSSYEEPLETWLTNVQGTVNLLESLKTIKQRCAVIIITTDKVYKNKEWDYAYRETDTLGGHDPYSSSKAAVELAVSSWRNSFFSTASSQVHIATARAGNVIGGGDWAENRIVPDMIRSLSNGEVIPVRNPDAVRPWQHVLEPLGGYISLAEQLYDNRTHELKSAFNFGPFSESIKTVQQLVDEGLKHWQGKWENHTPAFAPHEARILSLTTDKARSLLGWSPRWTFNRTVASTITWYKQVMTNEISAKKCCLQQIHEFYSIK
jgi:CDP-glucose 4,6-dehydratase